MPCHATDQVIESNRKAACSTLPSNLARPSIRLAGDFGERQSLYSESGERKYLNRVERLRFLRVIEGFETPRALFCLVLTFTGARLSEVLALSARSFDLDMSTVCIVTLKRRKHSVREVPIPRWLTARLARHFMLRTLQQGEDAGRKLWPWCAVTGWRIVKAGMKLAEIVGLRACPRGLRHAFGVISLQGGAHLNLIQRWMGHARMTTTAIYASVSGPEEWFFAEKVWRFASGAVPPEERPHAALAA
ncbi:site-specific integrase [Bradyrhizobium sp. CCGUVB14]|uniref:tyrosine-type recombinase/integrase n=1 Tax=Bradyrhizobium sp. CCGUVB14 TaxID=2949628 RepID=UPI0020B3221E|nr:site-specific integrase [Bradyrhizobium sp. CCGUVB14]MCP3439815.1 site-specific integrase [Bradyrhizobium sp. CCGUVB14]